MKKLSVLLFALFMVLAACKKDQPAAPADPSPVAATTPVQGDGAIVITGIAPASGVPNTLVTISGSNFGSSALNMTVVFNGAPAAIQSVTPTEIKVLVPVTTTGNITVILGSRSAGGPLFTYVPPELNGAYVSGNVSLLSQQQVDLFVSLNKGRALQITGNLTLGAPGAYSSTASDISSLSGLSVISSVSGTLSINNVHIADAPFLNNLSTAGGISLYDCDFTALRLNALQGFSGSLSLNSLDQLSRVEIIPGPVMNNVGISLCPLLTDVSFLSKLTSANNFSLSGLGISTVALDQLTNLNGSLSLTSNSKLTSVSFRALTGLPAGALTVSYSPLLTTLNFRSLTTMIGKLTLRNLNIADMSGFSALQNAGSLQLVSDPLLQDLHGLEQLTQLTSTAVIVNTISGNSPISRVNGMYISGNNQLASLNGLQNLTAIPIAYISGNPLLNDFCPFKKSLSALQTLPVYSYTYTDQVDQRRTTTIAALTLISNGSYVVTADVIKAVAGCK